jgi:hypothetical protein
VNTRKKKLNYALLCIGLTGTYVVVVFPFLMTPGAYLTNDNGTYHLNSFFYFANVIQKFHEIPIWYPWNGGTPVGITSINLFPLLPHRLASYALYGIMPIPPLWMYKVNLLLGIGLVVLGWYLFLGIYLKNQVASSVGTFLFLISGAGVTIFHQEQIIATMTYVPWILICVVKCEKSPKWLIAASVLCGLALTTHYPQIFAIGLLMLLLYFFLAGYGRALLRFIFQEWRIVFSSIGFLLLAASPAIFLYDTLDNFSSPLRSTEDVSLNSIEEYIIVNKLQVSSAPFEYLGNLFFVKFWPGQPNGQFGFFFPSAGWLFIVLGLVYRSDKALPLLALTILFVWAASGINLGFGQMLFSIEFPFINMFRQWYHFFPFVQFGLSLLAALGVSRLVDSAQEVGPVCKKGGATLVIITIAVTVIISLIQSASYFQKYYEPTVNVPITAEGFSQLSERQFKEYVNEYRRSDKYSRFRHKPLMIYKEWRQFDRLCADKDVGGPEFAQIQGLSEAEVVAIFRKLCQVRDKVSPIIASWRGGDLFIKEVGVNNLTVTGRSLGLTKARLQTKSLVVFPISGAINVEAIVDGKMSKSIQLYDGAYTGVWINPKNQVDDVLIVAKWDDYSTALLLQLVAILVSAGFLVRRNASGDRRLRAP